MAAIADYVPVWKLREIIGEEAATALLSVYGGTKLRVPAASSVGSRLTELVGWEAAEKLSQHFKTMGANGRLLGATIELPSGRKAAFNSTQVRLQEMIEAGATDLEILAELDVVDRTIRRWRARLGKGRGNNPGPQHPRLKGLVCDLSRSAKSIAEELGVSDTTVYRWRREFVPKLTLRASGRGSIGGALTRPL